MNAFFLIGLSIFLLVSAVPPAGAGDEFAPGLENKWTGDFDGMVKHRTVRVLIVYNKMMFFLDKGRYRGATQDAFLGFEEFLNKKLKTGTLKVKVIFIPVTRDRRLPALVEGLGDIAAANLTITPERLKNVDFSDPFLTGVNEIVVTGPTGLKLEGLDGLAGQIAWAFRKESPKLKAMVNQFVKDNKKGTLTGNILLKQYLKENKWARNATSPEELKKLNQTLFAFAAYNAGPAKVSKLRKEAKKMGLDSNVWFNNVEEVAAKRIGREKVQYVSNIYKYYTAYRLIFERKKAEEKVKKVVRLKS